MKTKTKTTKIVSTAAAMVAAVMVMPFGASAYTDNENDGTYKDFRYREVGDGVAITDYIGDSENVKVPESIGGKSVESIWYHAFSDKTGIKSVYLPSSISEIGVQAFSGCTSLEDINIPLWTDKIQQSAFAGCTSLTSVTIPDYCSFLGSAAFKNCPQLTDITVGTHTDVSYDALTGTGWFEEQPDGLVYLGTTAYAWKGEMPEHTSIEFKDGTEKVGQYIFWKNPNVETIVVPESVQSIGWMCFSECAGLKSVTFMNPKCNMEYFAHTISNYQYSVKLSSLYYQTKSAYTGIIIGADKSYAQQYAKQFKYTFRTFDDVNIQGDVNDDGEFNVADLVSLSNRLMKKETVGFWQMGDMNGDGKLNVFDMIDMREAIASASEN